MTFLFQDDICWCADSDHCGITECFRHLSHRTPQSTPDIFTTGCLQDTPNCPYYELESEEVNNEFQ